MGSTMHTDEYRSYSSLNYIKFVHDTVCHKYAFVNSEYGANAQAVDSLKLNLIST